LAIHMPGTMPPCWRGSRPRDYGYLKASGHPESHFDGEEWTGEIDFARHPGIFELAPW